MTESARKKIERAEKRSKKRKGNSDGNSKKKTRKGSSGDALKTALVKDAQVRAGSRPIFVQPPNLADGCYLKDYQLEGVRWLASLFENGVSGILADEVCTRFCVGRGRAAALSASFIILRLGPNCLFHPFEDGSGKDDSSHCTDRPPADTGRIWTLLGCGTSCDATQLGP